MTKRNQRNKSARNTARRNRLVTLRAELMLTLENEVKPHHLTYNARKTEQLIREFRQYGGVPGWANNYVKFSHINDPTRWHVDETLVDDWADAMVYGQSIYKMTVPST
jgi:hypothetical protein